MTKKPGDKTQHALGAQQTTEPPTTSSPSASSSQDPPKVKEKKRRAPRLTYKQVWLIYAQVVQCGNPDQVFDILARTFESRSDLGYWLHRIRHGKKISLGKKRDFVQYFRAVAHGLFKDTRGEA